MIYLKEISIQKEMVDSPNDYPFRIPAIKEFKKLDIVSDVTFFVGENGSGKSTFLEAIAISVGFNPLGGNKNHAYSDRKTESSLHQALKLAWMPKTHRGFFLRSESFFHFSTAVEQLEREGPPGLFNAYGGKSLHDQSHGESFFALFSNKFKDGLFLMDEPEAALSPMRQLSLLRLIKDKLPKAQFIIATHSPILLAFPNAQIMRFGDEGMKEVPYEELESVQLYKNFLNHPGRYLQHLFSEDE